MIDFDPKIFSVFELTSQIKKILENDFTRISVCGEISNFTRARSGHWYFVLKDERALIKAVMFKRSNLKSDLTPTDGLQVVCLGNVTLYEPHGALQIIIEQIKPLGVGALFQAFERLKERLQTEGLFDPQHKKSLPLFPRGVGVVTSPTGAAVRDILKILGEKFPGIRVIIYPVKVQGDGAAAEIAAALECLNRLDKLDVIIVARGGGSLEDLWPFNQEEVARAIYNSALPVISGVGHETDFTIADFVSDFRAPTPTAAADMAVPNAAEIREKVDIYSRRIQDAWQKQFREVKNRFHILEKQLISPNKVIENQQLQLDDLTFKLQTAIQRTLREIRVKLENSKSQLVVLNPMNVLKRGYCLAQITPSGRVLIDSKQVAGGEQLLLTLNRGKVNCRVTGSD